MQTDCKQTVKIIKVPCCEHLSASVIAQDVMPLMTLAVKIASKPILNIINTTITIFD